MKQLIKTLFQKSIELGDMDYTLEEINSNWIGNEAATKEMIKKAEEKLKVSLPEDYKALLLISNGFKTSCDSVEPSFLPVQEIEYLKDIDPFVIECYEDTLKELEDSIVVAGKEEEQQFLLIPPKHKDGHWKYWKFANWIPGEEEYNNIKEYLESVIDFIEESIKEKQ